MINIVNLVYVVSFNTLMFYEFNRNFFDQGNNSSIVNSKAASNEIRFASISENLTGENSGSSSRELQEDQTTYDEQPWELFRCIDGSLIGENDISLHPTVVTRTKPASQTIQDNFESILQKCGFTDDDKQYFLGFCTEHACDFESLRRCKADGIVSEHFYRMLLEGNVLKMGKIMKLQNAIMVSIKAEFS